MAGKRQHFIPQFLQKGFASHNLGDEFFTWVYRKGKKAFNPNIKNVGVEGFFYSEDHNPELDDVITAVEGNFAHFVHTLPLEGDVQHSDSARVAQLFAHLEIRTRHIRQNLFSTGNDILDELLASLSDPVLFKIYVRRKIKNDPSLIEEPLAEVFEVLRKQGFPQEMRPVLRQMSESFIEQAIMPNMINQMPGIAGCFRTEMLEKLKKASKTGHIKALTQTIAPDVKVCRYETLSYKVVNSEEISLPLGDSAVLFHVSEEREFKPFLEQDDDLKAVILPISSRQVLVGSPKNYQIDLSALRRAIVGCSREYFIASEASPDNDQLSNYISENAHWLSGSQIENLIDEIMNE